MFDTESQILIKWDNSLGSNNIQGGMRDNVQPLTERATPNFNNLQIVDKPSVLISEFMQRRSP